jgi:hypothetical protein
MKVIRALGLELRGATAKRCFQGRMEFSGATALPWT